MPGNRESSRKSSLRMAFCGMMTALSVSLMLTGGLIPIATYCTPMMAGVLLLVIMAEFGKSAAWVSFAATALISLFLGTDKEAAFFYLSLGYYPIIKWDFEKIRSKPFRLAAKVLFVNAMVALMYAVLAYLFHMDAVFQDFAEMGKALTAVFFVFMTVCMLIYDRLLVPLLYIYANRIRPKLRFLNT